MTTAGQKILPSPFLPPPPNPPSFPTSRPPSQAVSWSPPQLVRLRSGCEVRLWWGEFLNAGKREGFDLRRFCWWPTGPLNPGQKTFFNFFKNPIFPKHRYCPSCKIIVVTRILLEGYPKLRFTASRPKSARSYAEQTLMGQVAAGPNSSLLKYWRIRF